MAVLVSAAVFAAVLALDAPAAAAPLSVDRAALSTDHIGAGGLVTVRAGGFAPLSSVQMLNGRATGAFGEVFGTPLTSDAQGNVSATVGENLRRGTYRVRFNGLTPANELRTVSGVYTVQQDNCGLNPCAQADLPSTGGSSHLLLAGGLLLVAVVGSRLLRSHVSEGAAIVAAVAVIAAAFTLTQPLRHAEAAPGAPALSGTVRSLHGRGLAGVCVHAANTGAFGAAVTDAAGRYSIRGLRAGEYSVDAVDCNASTMLFGKHLGTVKLSGSNTVRNVAMARGGVLAGRVTDEVTGQGLAGNCLHLAAGRAFGAKCALGSGANGVFVSEPMPPGSYGLAFQDLTGRYAIEYLGGHVSPAKAERAQVRSGRVSVAQASAQAATTVEGTVVDDGTNQPSSSICALLLSNDQPTMMSAATGQDGKYTIGNVAAGTYKVQFSDCSGNSPAYVTQYFSQKATVQSADPVAVADGQPRSGIDARMSKSGVPNGSTTTTSPSNSTTTSSTTSTSTTALPTTTTSTAPPSTTSTAPPVVTTTTAAPSAGTPTRMTPTEPAATSTSAVRPGGSVTVTGDGFRPGSTVNGALFSTPASLGSKSAGATGSVSFDVTIPRNFELGAHEIQLQGVDALNRTRVLSAKVQVTNALVRTGSDSNVLMPVGAALVVLGGAGVYLGRRRLLGAHFLR